jgi:predicted membrane protein
VTQTERDAMRQAAARARREAAQVLREKARAAKMAARAEAIAARAESRLTAREELFDARRDAKVARGVAQAMRESDRRTNHQVLGAVLLAIGGNWLLAEFGLFTMGWPGLFAVALMTLGMAMVGTAKAGRTKPLIALGIVLTLGLAMSSSVSGPVRGPFVGDRVEKPSAAAQVRSSYEHNVGGMTLDLGAVDFEPGLKSVDVELTVGDLEVILPHGVAVDVTAEIGGVGDISMFGAQSEGIGADAMFRDQDWETAESRLDLDLVVRGVGDITVVRH